MKVMMLAMDYPPNVFSGIGVYSHELATSLSSLGVEVDVFAISQDNYIASNEYIKEYINGHTVYRFIPDEAATLEFMRRKLPSRSELRNIIWNITASNVIKVILDIALERKYDLIHIQDYFNIIIAEAIKSAINIPIVNTVHDTGIGGDKMHYHLRHYTCLVSDRNIAVSNYQADKLTASIALGDRKIDVIYNGVSMSKHGNDMKTHNIAFVGRLTHTKGCKELLQAFSNLVEREHTPIDCKLIFVGDGPIRDELIDYATDKGLISRVMFMGYQSNDVARRIMHESMMLVAPSKREAFGIVALEAMAEETCVIASKGTGFCDYISDNINGILVDPCSIDEICDAIDRVLSNEHLRRHLVKNGVKTARKMNWINIAEKTVEVYKDTLEKYSSK